MQDEGQGTEVMPRGFSTGVGQAWSTLERLCCWAGASTEAGPGGVERARLGGRASDIGCRVGLLLGI